jgi:FkbM family methyltransferase
MNILKRSLISFIPNIKLTMSVPMGGKIRFRARSHKGFLVRKLTDYAHERVIFEFYDAHVQGPMTVFDVGANIGLHSIPLGRRLDAGGGRVIAFEPDADNLALLHENVRLNGLEKTIAVVEQAVDAEPGVAMFYRDTASGATGTISPKNGNAWYQQWVGKPPVIVQVATTSIDAFCDASGITPDLIKIDVEGAEDRVLHGMKRLLSDRRVRLICDGVTAAAVDILREARYELFDLETEGMRIRPGPTRAYTILASAGELKSSGNQHE